MDHLTRKRQGTVSNHCAKASLPALFILHDECRDDSDNVLLLAAWELRDILKDLAHFPRRSFPGGLEFFANVVYKRSSGGDSLSSLL